MATRYSPKAALDGLVFYYDTGNKKSYAGEPSTNLAPPSLANWGTENTAERIATGRTYLGQPTFNCRTTVGASYQGIDTTISGLRTAAGSSGTVTMSCMVKNNNGTNYNMYAYIGHDFSGTRTILANSDWQKVQWTVNQSSMNNDYVELRPWTNSANTYLEMTMPMVEVNKGHATQFTTGTRTSTDSLKDLMKNSTIDLSNVSFDGDAQMTFDGTNDYINFPAGTMPNFGTGNFAIEVVFRMTKTSSYSHFYQVKDQYHFALKMSNGNQRIYVYRTSGLSTYNDIPADTTLGAWHHLVCQRNGDNIEMYLNGEYKGAKSGWGGISIEGDTYDTIIGKYNNEYSQGDQPITKVYNRALSAEEVAQNYNAIKGRFGI